MRNVALPAAARARLRRRLTGLILLGLAASISLRCVSQLGGASRQDLAASLAEPAQSNPDVVAPASEEVRSAFASASSDAKSALIDPLAELWVGNYGMRLTVPVQWDSRKIMLGKGLKGGEGDLTYHLLLERRLCSRSELNVFCDKLTLCSIKTPTYSAAVATSTEHYNMQFDPSAFMAHAQPLAESIRSPFTPEVTADGVRLGRSTSQWVALQWGVDLGDPFGPWPDWSEILAHAAVDSDYDGNPGATSYAITGGSNPTFVAPRISKAPINPPRASAFHVATRLVFRYQLSFDDPDYSSGYGEVAAAGEQSAVNVSVIGCQAGAEPDARRCDAHNLQLIASGSPQYRVFGERTAPPAAPNLIAIPLRGAANPTCQHVLQDVNYSLP